MTNQSKQKGLVMTILTAGVLIILLLVVLNVSNPEAYEPQGDAVRISEIMEELREGSNGSIYARDEE